MTEKKLKEKANKLLSKLENLIKDEMPFQGNLETESQKVCILNAIRKVEMNINGIKKKDLKKGSED